MLAPVRYAGPRALCMWRGCRELCTKKTAVNVNVEDNMKRPEKKMPFPSRQNSVKKLDDKEYEVIRPMWGETTSHAANRFCPAAATAAAVHCLLILR